MLDRIDIFITIQAIKSEELIQMEPKTENESDHIRLRVKHVRHLQIQRQQCLNAHLNPKDCEKVCENCFALEKKNSSLMKNLEKFTKGSEMLNVILKA